ncbi:uncharacterized protein LOC133802030 [Humulus lupulus]|uniref:uncharacterized protein LOC133802030 n=1 Tax=Humulus lupulus TaxID=3486 RepID=UPI002B4065AD|nr:uncharacterized protein LOC133802030 [Humulus lupulus]
MMMALRFPMKFIELVMSCVTTPRFSFMINGAQNGYLHSNRGLRQGDLMSPLLFVIGLEYLSRILVKVAQQTDFKFHPRCESLKLTHLCLADDLLLFSKGDFKAIHLMLRGFQFFRIASKQMEICHIWCGVEGGGLGSAYWMTCFIRSSLPFNYLRMTMSNKINTRADYECLVDKMVVRMRNLSSRNLSFAERCILINFVLLLIDTYRSQVVILPKTVLKRINQICRAFLWKSIDNYVGPGRVISWAEMCKSKQKGWLGFKDIGLWNFCTIIKYVWAIAKKEDNLWVKWVHNVYLKEVDWWSYNAPTTSRWYWNQIVKTKNELKEVYPHNEISWPSYSIAKVHKQLKKNTEIRWKYSPIWDRLGIPKHKFVTWLALKRRLQTRDRLTRFGVTNDPLCVICGQFEESHIHLFFECHFSNQCIHQILYWLSIGSNRYELIGMLNWVRRSRHSCCRIRFYYCALIANVYQIWRAQNDACWNLKVPMACNVALKIKTDIYNKISFKAGKISKDDLDWVGKLQM